MILNLKEQHFVNINNAIHTNCIMRINWLLNNKVKINIIN